MEVFVANKNFLKLIKGDKHILEKKPLEKACRKKQLLAFKHYGFWKCMDVKRIEMNYKIFIKEINLNGK